MNRYLEIAVKAARTSGDYLSRRFHDSLEIEKKGEINLVTDADRESEKIIKKIITGEFPDHRLLAEEGEKSITDSEYFWLVDPLDGTTNYAHGFPIYCVSIALLKKDQVIAGCIFNPNLDECFTAIKGEGACLNGKPITVSGEEKLGESLLATGFPYDIRESDDDNIKEFSAFAKSARAVRRAGSAALDLAYVACGRFDGFWEFKLSAWDLAAGILMVSEAGGAVTSFKGGNCDIFTGEALASNGWIHSQMLEILSRMHRDINNI